MTPPFHCAHAGYTAAVRDPERGYLGTGNVESRCQYSSYLRADSPMTGWPVFRDNLPPSAFRAFRAAFEAEQAAGRGTAIGYLLFHRAQGARRPTIHGAFLTTEDHRLLWKAHTGPTWKSRDVVDKVIAHILPRHSAHQILAAMAA